MVAENVIAFCGGCPQPAAIQLYVPDTSTSTSDAVVAYADGDIDASNCSSCDSSPVGSTTWDGRLYSGTTCRYLPGVAGGEWANVHIVDGMQVQHLFDISVYHSDDESIETKVPGFCTPNDGVWIFKMVCSGTEVCDATHDPYKIWYGHNPARRPDEYRFTWIAGCADGAPEWAKFQAI